MHKITIELLKYHAHAIPSLAALWQEMLGKIWEPATPYDEIEHWFHEWMNDRIPLALIALDGTKPVGMCSVQMTDGIRPDLKPWLCDLCVHPAYQNQGIAQRLIEAAQTCARQEHFDTIYLFAPDKTIPNYYARLGWCEIGLDVYKGHPVTVMAMDLSNSLS